MSNWFLEQELRKRGYDYKLSGTFYVREAVRMAAQSEGRRPSLTKELYPAIGKAAGINAGAVERAVRTAVHRAEPGRTASGAIYEMAAVVKAYAD